MKAQGTLPLPVRHPGRLHRTWHRALPLSQVPCRRSCALLHNRRMRDSLTPHRSPAAAAGDMPLGRFCSAVSARTGPSQPAEDSAWDLARGDPEQMDTGPGSASWTALGTCPVGERGPIGLGPWVPGKGGIWRLEQKFLDNGWVGDYNHSFRDCLGVQGPVLPPGGGNSDDQKRPGECPGRFPERWKGEERWRKNTS